MPETTSGFKGEAGLHVLQHACMNNVEGAAMLSKFFGKRSAEVSPTPSFDIELVQIGGPPELEFLFINPPPASIDRALDGWMWAITDQLTVIAISAFGDTFFRKSDDTILLLDTIEGTLKTVADNLASFTASLQETEGRDELLLAGFVIGARQRGLTLGPAECYDFVLAPILGGETSVEQMQKLDYVVKVHIAGQLHEQVKDLPPGTKINHVTIADE